MLARREPPRSTGNSKRWSTDRLTFSPTVIGRGRERTGEGGEGREGGRDGKRKERREEERQKGRK